MLYREIEVDDSALLPKGSIEAAITPLSRPGNDVYWLAFVPDPQATADAAMGAAVMTEIRKMPTHGPHESKSAFLWQLARSIVDDDMPESGAAYRILTAIAAVLEEGEDEM